MLRCARIYFFFFQAEDGIRDYKVTGVQTCALPIFHLDRVSRRSWNLRGGIAQKFFQSSTVLRKMRVELSHVIAKQCVKEPITLLQVEFTVCCPESYSGLFRTGRVGSFLSPGSLFPQGRFFLVEKLLMVPPRH